MRNLRTIQNLVKAVYNDFATEYNIKDYPKLHHVFSIIAAESSWDDKAESPFARGLMQISQPALETVNALYNKSYTYDDMFNPTINTWVGIRYLRWLWRAFEGFEHREMLAVLSYNWGIGNVIDWLSEAKDNTRIDETVPAEAKNYLVSYLYWCDWYRRLLRGQE